MWGLVSCRLPNLSDLQTIPTGEHYGTLGPVTLRAGSRARTLGDCIWTLT